MKIPKKPTGKKALKDPILIMGKWEERVPPPPGAGTTEVDIKTLHPIADRDQIRAEKDIPYRPADKKK